MLARRAGWALASRAKVAAASAGPSLVTPRTLAVRRRVVHARVKWARAMATATPVAVEDTYERVNPVEHVLMRPGMYIGSIEKVNQDRYTFDRKSKSIVYRNVPFVPGLLKVFDEILVNAADNVERSASTNYIDVFIDEKSNTFIVENNGDGIPVIVQEKENMYVPEMVLGHLFTGSNFNDKIERFTGGRHGFGAKLTNIMSDAFEVETLDTERGKF